MTTTIPHLSPSEATQVAAANASGKQPVVFIHGLWLLASSWDAWKTYFEQRGYATVAIDWPGDSASVEADTTGAGGLAGLGVAEVTEHALAVIAQLTLKPLVIGHSFGGLIAQKVAGEGKSAATVAIDPAPFKGVLPLPFTALKASSPVLLHPANKGKVVRLTAEQFRYGFANAVDADEAAALYDTFHVAGPGRPLFQVATANVNPRSATAADTRNPERGPLLIISGGKDNTVPHAIAHASYRLQSRNPGVTEFNEIAGRGHSLVIDGGWGDVADVAFEFVSRR